MHWLGFIASLIKSLAWPVAIALVVWWLREPIRKRLEHLRRAVVGGQEFEFGEIVQVAEEAAAEASLPSSDVRVGEPTLSTELRAEINSAPRAAVVEAWNAVETELVALAEQVGIPMRDETWRRRGIIGYAEQLVGLGTIASALLAVVDELREARNLAVHSRGYTVDRDQAREYVDLAGRVRSALRLAAQANVAAEKGETGYDLFVYHDLSDPTASTGGTIPTVGERAERFGDLGKERHVVAVGPGIHPGRVTVVLAHGHRPMKEVRALLDRLADDGETEAD
jgi:hypothetical protein